MSEWMTTLKAVSASRTKRVWWIRFKQSKEEEGDEKMGVILWRDKICTLSLYLLLKGPKWPWIINTDNIYGYKGKCIIYPRGWNYSL